MLIITDVTEDDEGNCTSQDGHVVDENLLTSNGETTKITRLGNDIHGRQIQTSKQKDAITRNIQSTKQENTGIKEF